MGDLVVLAISCILINNIVLAQYLGQCPFMGTSKKMETAVGMAMAVVFVLVMAGMITWVVNTFFLQKLGLEYLRTVAFILVIASLVQFVEMFLKKSIPALYAGLGIFLPLIAVNCAILGGSLFMQSREITTFGLALNYGVSSGIGWFLAILAIAAIREKIRYSNVPPPLRGLGITFIITGLMGIGFQSFGGMLTGGGDSVAPVEETTVQQKEIKKEKEKENEEVAANAVSYSEVKTNE